MWWTWDMGGTRVCEYRKVVLIISEGMAARFVGEFIESTPSVTSEPFSPSKQVVENLNFVFGFESKAPLLPFCRPPERNTVLFTLYTACSLRCPSILAYPIRCVALGELVAVASYGIHIAGLVVFRLFRLHDVGEAEATQHGGHRSAEGTP